MARSDLDSCDVPASREVLLLAYVPPRVNADASLTPGTELSDEQLLFQFQCGSQNAFQSLYQRHYRRAHALALNLTRDENDASEVVQDAFMRVLLKWSSFDGDATFFTWLYRIVFNLSIDRLRRSSRRCVPIENVEDLLADIAGSEISALRSTDPFVACSTTEDGSRIVDAIRRLSSHHRDVIVLREVYGMSYAEMAEAIGCSKGTIMSRLFHARQRLQGMLQWVREE